MSGSSNAYYAVLVLFIIKDLVETCVQHLFIFIIVILSNSDANEIHQKLQRFNSNITLFLMFSE